MNSSETIKLIECPRDAMQGWKNFIPTEKKIKYLNSLLEVGFDTLDCGSFVSAKAIPQMADTKVVISNLQIADSKTRLLVIVANTRGAEEAIVYDQITYIGFPFSISPTFQLRNTNSTLEESLLRVHQIQDLCVKNNKQLVVYLSMGFGNPYGDEYNQEILLTWAEQIAKAGIQIVSLADTVGVATPPQIAVALSTLISHYPKIEIGVHLHSTPSNLEDKLQAALDAGCKRFDSAIKGIGGCPMANDDLIGNMKTERMLAYLKQQKFLQTINERALEKSIEIANDIFAM